MISRCPSCGSQVKEDEHLCGSCGWDFVARKRVTVPDRKPASPPSEGSSPSEGFPPSEFSMPAALSLKAPFVEPVAPDSKPLPKIEPGPPAVPPPEESPFALPVARTNIPDDGRLPLLPPAPIAAPLPEREALPLPAQADKTGIVPSASRPAPAAPAAPAKTMGAAVLRRGSPVYIAAVTGAAIGTVSVLAVYLLLRKEAPPIPHPSSGSSPFVAHPAADLITTPSPAAPVSLPTSVPITPQPPPPILPAPAPAPAPSVPSRDASRPAATFAAVPRVILTAPVPSAPKPAAAKPPPPRDEPPAAPGRTWAFEGVVFDLLTTRGVFAATLTFRDAAGNVVGETSTGSRGNYKVVLPAGGRKGYSLKITHGDYTERYIDEGDATSSLREATTEERRMLAQAAVRNLPWVGALKKPVRRDLGLVPKSPEEP